MRRIGRVWSVVAVAVVALAAGAYASTTPSLKHTIGTIDAYNAKEGVVDLRIGNTNEKISIDAGTTITEHGKTIQAAELQKGQRVLVDWTAKDGRTVASKVEVLKSTSRAAARKGRK